MRNTLTVGSEGINSKYTTSNPFIINGYITASGPLLIIQSDTSGTGERNRYGDIVYGNLSINSVIKNHATHEVGLVVKGSHDGRNRGLVLLSGGESNTFTGNVIVEGRNNVLYLGKKNGATAIQSKHVYVRSSARLSLSGSNQIVDASTVHLEGTGSQFSFTGNGDPSKVFKVSERIHALVVENGTGVLNFMHSDKFKDLSEKTLYLDDLIIKQGAFLRVRSWEAGRDHLLVRKDSKYLKDALKKISIDGWAKNQVYLKDYDKDYWSIEAAPEPSTCGALFGALGVGLVVWRRRKDRSR